MVKIKICGITNMADAKCAVACGCDGLGFVFYKKSPRYIPVKKAAKLIKALPKKITKFGVFVNCPGKTILDIAQKCKLDILQFHGNESASFCGKFKGYKVIKAFRIKDRPGLENILKYKTFGYLFDTFVSQKPGGTGKAFKWSLVPSKRRLRKPIFLSGGLNKHNVRQAIKTVKPAWVDISTGVESAPGKKDKGKIREFIETIKR